MENVIYIIFFSIGFLATALSLLYRIPQMYKIYKTKRGKDISLYTILIQTISYICYIAYSVYFYDIVYIISNVLSMIQNLGLYLMIQYYKKYGNEKNNGNGENERNSETRVYAWNEKNIENV